MFVVHYPEHIETVSQLEGDKISLQSKVDQLQQLVRYLSTQLYWVEGRSQNVMGRRVERKEPMPEYLQPIFKETLHE